MKKRRFLALLLALCMLALPVLTACDGLGDIGDELDNLLGEGSGSDGSGNSTSPKPEDSKPTPELPKPEDSKPTPPDPVGPKPEGPLPGESDDTSDESGKDEKPKPEDKSEFDEASGLQYTLSPKGDFYTVTAVKPLKATHVVIPKEYKGVPVTTIEKNAFSGCTDLQSIYLSNGLTHISAFAFFKCSSLKTIVIPESVVVIGSYAFDGCESLNIYCEADSQPQKWDKKWNPDNLPVTWGYTCEHSWTEATCTEPSACSVCGAVDGEALGHDIVDGYCTRCDYEEEKDDDTSDSTDNTDSSTSDSSDTTDSSDKTDDSTDNSDTTDSSDKTDTDDKDDNIDDDGEIIGNNIASSAEITLNDNWWAGDPQYLVDGDWSTASLSSIHTRYATFTFTWDKSYRFSTLVFVVNGQGSAPVACIDFSEPTNNSFNFSVTLYDEEGNKIYAVDGLSAEDIETYRLDVNCEAAKIDLTIDGKYTYYPIFEVETYAVVDESECIHYWKDATCVSPKTCVKCGETRGELGEHIFDTYVETVSPTCTKEGYDTYVCSFCGNATEERNYVEPLGHSYSNGKCIRCDKIAPSANGNIAPEATPDCSTESWITDPQYINDGDRTTGSAGSYNSRYVTYSLKFIESRYVDTIVLVTNGVGSCPVDSSLVFDTVTQNSYNFKVTCLDGLGATVYSASLHSINDANEDQEVILELGGIKIREVRIEIESQWSLYNGLWEVEIYEDDAVCNHSWIDATCTEPAQCRYCGQTEGEALGHTGGKITCVSLATCERCGEEYGDYTDHRLVAASCTVAEYCRICGATFGEALGHEIIPATCTEADHCLVCGITFGNALGHSYDKNNVCERCGYIKRLVGLDDIESLTASHTGGGAANLEKLFDGLKMSAGMWSNDTSKEYYPQYSGDYLTIVLKEEVNINKLVLWTCGNWTSAKVSFFDAVGNEIGSHSVIYMSDDPSSAVMSTPEEIAFDSPIKVKTIVLTAVSIKYEGQSYSGQKTSEIEIYVEPCEENTHNWQDATCKSPKTCITCGLTEGEALGHVMDVFVEVVPPTCVDMGCDIYTCSFCHDIIEHFNYVDALGHNYILEDKTVVAPTCTEDGYSYTYCTRCRLEYFFDFVPATGHSFVDDVCLNCGAYDEVLVTYCYFNGSVWETATANRDGTYTLRTAKKSSNGTVTLADGTVVDKEFYGWFDRDGNLYAPGQSVVFKQDTCLYEAYGVTVYNADDFKRVVSSSYQTQAYVKLGADITVDTTISGNWSIMLIDLNGHTLTSTAKDRAVFVQRGSFALVGEGRFIHQPSTVSIQKNVAGVYFQAHGYADADYPQLFWIGKDVTFKTPYSALYVQTVVLDGTPNIYVAGNVNAKALAYINPVTTGALCEIADTATLILKDSFIEYPNTVTNLGLISIKLNGSIIVNEGNGSIVTDLLENSASIIINGGKFGVCEADRNKLIGYLSDTQDASYLISDKIIGQIDDEDIIVRLTELVIRKNDCNHLWQIDSTRSVAATNDSLGFEVKLCSLCGTQKESVVLYKIGLTVNGELELVDANEIFDIELFGKGLNTQFVITGFKDDSFYPNSSISQIQLPYGINKIGASTFKGFKSLTKIALPDSLVEIDNYAFQDCTSLTGITIPDSVTTLGSYLFRGCTGLTSITIPGSVKTVSSDMFYNCKNLKSVTLEEGIESIAGYAFQGCTSLTSIQIPSSVTSVNYSAFQNCTAIRSINVANGNQKYKSIDGNLYNVDGTELVKYATGKTDTSFAIPDSVTSIGNYAFENSQFLLSIYIPSSVTRVGYSSFYGCTGLTIYCEAESQPSGWSSLPSSCTVVWGHKQ